MPLVPHAKIAVPPLPPEFVERAALRAKLDTGATACVTLVCAPAGYGKTLLLADSARGTTGADIAWVSLDSDDNDPRRLWASVVAALAACPSVLPTNRLRQPWIWRSDAQPEFLADLVEALENVPRPIRLILDDVHELVGSEALHGLQILTRTRPSTLQLVLASRLDPPLSLPRLRLAGALWELRAAQMRFSRDEAAALFEKSGLHLTPAQVDLLSRRTGGWAAGLRLAASGAAQSADRDAFLAQFSGNERSVADYLVEEVLTGLPEDVQEFLRVISISEPVPVGLAAELSGRADAGNLLDGLEHRTSLVTPTGRRRDSYSVQELLRAHLRGDLRRQGLDRAAELHGVAAQWWADRLEPVQALDHAAMSQNPDVLIDMLHRFAVPLVLAGDHEPLRRALACAGTHAVATDPWLALTSALTHVEAGELPAARDDLRHARRAWPSRGHAGLTTLLALAEQMTSTESDGVDVADGSGPATRSPSVALRGVTELPVEPELEALARLYRGTDRLERNDPVAARAELETALHLSRRHGFGYLTMQCFALLGFVAGIAADVQTMRTMSIEALTAAREHGWERSTWSAIATAMLAYTALMRSETTDAGRLAAEGLALDAAAVSPELRFALHAVSGAAAFDRGDRAAGLAELHDARSEFGEAPAHAILVAALATLEFRAALLLGHSAAARTVLGWLDGRVGDCAELQVMRAWTEATAAHHEHARSLLRPVLDGEATVLLPHSLVDAWLLEASLAFSSGERPAARRALQSALAVAAPLDALRPFAYTAPGVRELLVHQHGSFGALDAFAERALAAGANGVQAHTLLSERELTVLALLPSLLSLDEIATDLTVSVNTVKSHVRSIYAKLGVSSRRLAVLAAHERGLLTGDLRPG